MSAANAAKTKKSEGGFVHNVKKTVGKITVEVTVDQKYTQSCQQLSKFVDQIKQLKRLVGVYIRQQRALLQASAGVCDHFNLLIQQGGATSEFAPLADNNRRVHQQYLAVAVTDTKKDAAKPPANAAQVMARKEEKRGPAIAGAGDENKDGVVEFEEEPEVEIGVEGKDIKHVVTKLAEVDGIVAGLRARMKDREQLMSEMDYYRAKVGKLRREYEQQQKLRMEGKIRGIPQKDVDRLERNENHLTISTDRYNVANTALIRDLNFVWSKRCEILGHIMAEYIRAEKGFYKTGIAVNDEVIASSRARATPWQLLMVLKESAELYPVNLGSLEAAAVARHEQRLNVPLAVAAAAAQAQVGMPPSSPPSISSYSAPSSSPSSPPSANGWSVSQNGTYPTSSPSSPAAAAAASVASVSTPPMSYPTSYSSSSSSGGGIGGVGGYDSFVHNPFDLPPPVNPPLPPLPQQAQPQPQPSYPMSNGIVSPVAAAAAAAPVVHLGISGVAGTGSRRASLNPFDEWNSPEGQPHRDPFAAQSPQLAVSTNSTVMTPPGGAHFAATPVARPAVPVVAVAPPAVVAPTPVPVAAADWDPFGGGSQADPWGSTDDPFPSASPFAAAAAPVATPPVSAAVTARPTVVVQQPAAAANPFDFLASQAPSAQPVQQAPSSHNAFNNPFF